MLELNTFAKHFGLPVQEDPKNVVQTFLRKINLLKNSETLVAINSRAGWERLGSETYILTFSFDSLTEDYVQSRRTFIAKAITKYKPNQVFCEWNERVKKLKNLNVNVPRFYSYHEGTIFQQYIPYSFDEAWSTADGPSRKRLIQELGHIASALDYAGFSPVSLIHDLRAEKEKIYIVDFGSDLGAPKESNAYEECVAKQKLTSFAKRMGYMDQADEAYERRKNSYLLKGL